MQFLRRQRNGRKRKSLLEKIGLNGEIKSSTAFYDKYDLLNRLQTGGQGTIHSIKCKKSDEKKQELEGNETSHDESTSLVVKMISFADIDNESIANELRTALKQYQLISKKQLLNHSGIYYDESKKQLLIVTEKLRMNLEQLQQYMSDINESQLKVIFSDILYKLYLLHQSGHTHNDITPFNVMCNYNNEWSLIDYDMILKIDNKRGYTKDCWKGTIGYVSKEIGHNINSSNNRYSFSSDLWSFGLVLLYVLNGFRNPFEITESEIIENELNTEDEKLEYFYKCKLTAKEYENKVQFLLITWLAYDKISFDLYDLLLNYLLVFNAFDRAKSCQDIMSHPWFYNYIRKNKNNKYKECEIETGEIQTY